MTADTPPSAGELQRLIEQHQRRAARKRAAAAKKREPQPKNGWDRIRAKLRRWQAEDAPVHRLICEAGRTDHYIGDADLDQLVAKLQTKGIVFSRYQRTRLSAERRGKPIGELDSELIRRFARQIFKHIG